MTALPLLLLLSATAGAGAAAPPGPGRGWSVAPGSTLAYHLVHKFHSVDGVARDLEGRARLLADGTLQVVVRARVAAFDSGNSNRDAHMMEVTEAARFPYVTVKAAAAGIQLPAVPGDLDVPLDGTLDLHGVPRPLAVTAHVHLASPERAEVTADFPVSLTAHGVERPSLLFVKVEDRIEIRARLVLAAEP